MQPPVHDDLARQVGPFVVTRHQERRPPDDLPHLAGRDILAVVVDDPHVAERWRHAHRRRLRGVLVLVQDRHETLGQPVELVEHTGHAPRQLLAVLGVERRAHRAEHPQGRHVNRCEPRRAEERDDLRRDHEDVRHPLAPDRVDDRLRVEVVMQDESRSENEGRHQREERSVEAERAECRTMLSGLIRHARPKSVPYSARTRCERTIPFGRPVVPLL